MSTQDDHQMEDPSAKPKPVEQVAEANDGQAQAEGPDVNQEEQEDAEAIQA